MFSKKTQLCIDVLLTIGSAPESALITTQKLAKKMCISISHIESIMRLLREAGFVRSVRGPGGGYCTTGQLAQMSVWSVVSALETPDDSDTSCSYRATDSLERSLNCEIKSFLSNKTIGEFFEADSAWHCELPSARLGFRLGPEPLVLKPIAPNSVFDLALFLHREQA